MVLFYKTCLQNHISQLLHIMFSKIDFIWRLAVSSVVEHLSSIYQTLCSIPISAGRGWKWRGIKREIKIGMCFILKIVKPCEFSVSHSFLSFIIWLSSLFVVLNSAESNYFSKHTYYFFLPPKFIMLKQIHTTNT